MATKKQVNDFINIIAPIAIDICNATSKKVLPSVCIAQACCESAYGTSPKMIRANAIFGIKVGKSKVHFGNAWKDKAYSTKTKECYDGKTYVEINDMFRAYDTIRDSVQDYYDMLGACSRYAKCINEKDYVKSITAIKNGGYATSPTYINTITSIIKKYNLTQYDACMTGKVENKFITGNYILTANMKVRRGPGTYYSQKSKHELTISGQKHSTITGVLKKGTEVTVQEVIQKNNEYWAKIPSGYIAICINNQIYMEKL